MTVPPGTTLYFMCAAHPWLQTKLVVTLENDQRGAAGRRLTRSERVAGYPPM